MEILTRRYSFALFDHDEAIFTARIGRMREGN